MLRHFRAAAILVVATIVIVIIVIITTIIIIIVIIAGDGVAIAGAACACAGLELRGSTVHVQEQGTVGRGVRVRVRAQRALKRRKDAETI